MPQRIFRIEGNIINLQGTGVSKLRVEAWDKDLLLDDFLGSAITGAHGSFVIEFPEERFRELFLDKTPDVFFIVYSGSKKLTDTRKTFVCSLGEGAANVTVKVDFPAGETPPERKDEFLVKGIVKGIEGRVPGQILVKVSDVRRRERKYLGETLSDSAGHYELSFGQDKLLEPDKGYGNLKLELYDPVANKLLLGESDVVFKAPPVLELNVAVTRTYSEYERYTAIVREATKGDALSALKDDDIPFISNETGIERQSIEYLIAAARLGKQTEQPAGFFYGLAQQGFPTTLTDLVEQDSEALREALDKGFDENIIPVELREQIDSFLEQLKKRAEVDQGIQIKRQKEKLKRLGTIADLDDAKLDAILKRVSGPAILDDRVLGALVESGELEEEEARELGLVTSLNTLFDENIELAAAIKKGTFNKLPQGKVGRIDELVAFEKEDWLEILKEADATPPQGITQEGHAELITKTVEHLYPSKALWTRMMSKETTPLGDGLEALKPLFERNERVFAVDRFERLDLGDLDDDAREKLRSAHTSLKHFANAYPGLHLAEILDDRQLSPTKKQALVTARLNLLKRFEKTHPNVEFLKLDYVPDSADMKALNFTDFSEDERRMVLDTMKGYQRVHAVTRDVSTAKMVLEGGFHSLLGMTNGGFTEFKLATGLNDHEAKANFGRALELATESAFAGFGLVDAGSGSFGQMPVDNPSPDAADYLRKIDGWESLFGNLDYCHCPHCRSVLSPAAYLVDLMYFVEKNSFFHIPDGAAGFRAKEDAPLHLRSRRPDLWKLPLTCENTNKRIPYLDIINEVLENYIAVTALGVDASDLPEVGEDRSTIEESVYIDLSTSARSFNQPFSLPLERLAIYLEHFDITRGEVSKLLAEPDEDSDDTVAAAVLNLSMTPDSDYQLITEESPIRANVKDPIYQLRFEPDPRDSQKLTFHDPNLDPEDEDYEEEKEQSRKDVQVLLKAMGLKRAELGDLITTGLVTNEAIVEINSEKRVVSGPDKSVQDDIERIHGLSDVALDRMHRFTRLWRRLPWTIRELDLVLSHLAGPEHPPEINAATLRHLASILEVQERFQLSVEECCAIWSALPTISLQDDRDSLFDRLFNLDDFVRHDDRWNHRASAGDFLHPAFRSTPPGPGEEIKNDLHRLRAGLRVDDKTLLQLITNLLFACDLRLMVASDNNSEDDIIRTFEMELESDAPKCAILIVREAMESGKWTIAGYSDTEEFNTVVIDDPAHELAKELKKDPINAGKVARLAASNLSRTLFSPLGASEDATFPLTLDNLSLLYRHARLAEGLKLSVPQLFQLIQLANAGATSYIGDLNEFLSVLKLHEWWQTSGYTLDELEFLTSTLAYSATSPDAESVTKQILTAIKADQALTFGDTVFAFLEGVTEEQSKDIVAANLGVIAEAPGVRYQVSTDIDLSDPDPSTLPELDVPQDIRDEILDEVLDNNLLDAILEQVQATFATYAKNSYPVFDDSYFSQIEGVSEEQSRAIVAANSNLIIPAPLDRIYYLTHSFDPAQELTIPGEIPITQADVKAQLLTYHASTVIPQYFSVELGISREKTEKLISLALGAANLADMDSDFTTALQENDADGRLSALFGAFLRLSVLFKSDSYDSDAIDFVRIHSGDTTAVFGELPFLADNAPATIEDLRLLSIYRGFVERTDKDDGREQLHTVLTSFDSTTGGFYDGSGDLAELESIQEALSQVLGTEVGVAITAHEEIELPYSALLALDKLARCLAVAEQLGVGSETLALIVSNDFQNLRQRQAADAVFAAFRAKYEDETEWQEKIQPFEDKIRSRKRDALTDYLINSLDPKIFRTTNDLYHHFLLDTELEGCATTSRVVAATNSVQLYVHRIRMNLEQNKAESIRIELDIFADDEWEWRKNYRVWEANRKVFLFPENYLEPDLRDNKTPLFKELEATLLQQEITEESVLEAYTKYLRGFEEVSTLKIAGSFHEKYEGRDILHLFGVTTGETITYYYRSVENIYHGEHDDTKDTLGVVWNPWRKLDVPIPERKVAPIVFNNRLFVFWVEISTGTKNSSFSGGSSSFVGYRHRMSVKYTTLKPDRSWTTPQEIKLATAPFGDDDGVVTDYLWIGGWESRGNNYYYKTTPHYGSDDDIHVGKTEKEIVLSKLEEVVASAPRDLTARERWWLNTIFSDFDSKDSYRLRGFQWDQVYPYINNEGQLFLTGRNFEMRSQVDLLRLQLRSREGDFIGEYLPGELQLFPEWRFLTSQENTINYGVTAFIHLDPYASASILIQESRLEQYPADLFYAAFNRGKVLKMKENTDLSVVNGSLADAIMDIEGDILYLQSDTNGGEAYFVKRIGTTVSDTLIQKLFSEGASELLSTATQRTDLKEKDPAITIETGSVGEDLTGSGEVRFEGPYGVYFRELFLHIPFLIANHLNSQQKFSAAQRWYHHIFNPTAKSDSNDSVSEDRNWRYFEFRQEYRDLHDKGPMPSLREQMRDPTSIEEYKRNPFSPHAIARCPLRFSAYQKAVVMKYIDNLLDWGDDLFAQDTMESINEATLLYVLAADILGERPAELGECTQSQDAPNTYEQIGPQLLEDKEFLVEIFHQVKSAPAEEPKGLYQKRILPPARLDAAKKSAIKKLEGVLVQGNTNSDDGTSWGGGYGRGGYGWGGYGWGGYGWGGYGWGGYGWGAGSSGQFPYSFPLTMVYCFPENKDLLAYWDRVEDRLFKIRNCMNISGVRRELSLFAPEINPMLLVRAKAAGLSLEDVLNSINGAFPPYRFSYVIEKAKAYAAILQGFGAALLGALEKRNIEELNQLRAGQQQNILKMTSQIKQREIDAAVESYEALEKRIETIEYKTQYYSGLIGEYMSSAETLQSTSRMAASGLNIFSSALELGAAISYLVPQLGAPTAMKYGGKEIGDALSGFATAFHSTANGLNEVASMAGLTAGFERRKQGWEYQREFAEHELAELEKQKEVAEIRIAVAEELKEIHKKAIEQQQEIYELYRDKFTNLGLYDWLSTNLQRLYREAYNNAYAMAKLAEQAYRFERGDDAAELISQDHWVASKAGLLAGEGLLIDLQNLERRYLETNFRGLEVDQSFSLTQIDPRALIELKETGVCTFDVSEIYFDLFYPGHYRRRIKAVRLTIPCITGPYTNVSATLSLVSSQLRKEPKPGNTYLLDVPRSRSVTIATSTAQNDAGVFELNFRDERYMPFEGAGAVSSWELNLPKSFKQFDYQTINDVILHISYTAEEDRLLRDDIEERNASIEGTIQNALSDTPLSRVFSFRQEFSNEFNRLLYGTAGTEVTEVEFEISDKHFPIFLQGESLTIESAELVLRTEIEDLGSLSMTFNQKEIGTGNFERNDDWGGLHYAALTARDFEGGLIGHHMLSVANAGSLAPEPEGSGVTPPDTSTVDPEKLEDIYLYISYLVSQGAT